ncbi:FAD-binding domain-containing protein [Xylaria intraflava]|nr:FAD-binding domain-containing protein [Xylaria intraflava]
MSFVAPLQQHVKTLQPALPIITPADSTFEVIRTCFVKRDGNAPAAVARPQNAAHVQALVQYCTKNGVEFVVRSGGHDCNARSQVKGSLSIDMRDIKTIKVSADSKTATVGGGISVRDLAKELDSKGLVTPIGSVASVGYVGWATLGGYGPFTPRYGMGVDQIVGAKVVNAKGELIEAGPDLLQGIRGGGGTFGIIVELTIKVYQLKGLLSSLIVYESSDMKAVWKNFVEGHDKMTAEGPLPNALVLQLFGMEFPGMGKVFGVMALWADDDHEEGRKWFNRVAGFNTCVMNNPEPKTVSAFAAFNETMVVYGSYGRSYTMNVRKQTTKTFEVLGKYIDLLPGGGISLLAYPYRPTAPKLESIFGCREEHVLCEFVATTPVAELEAKGAEWARSAMAEIKKVDPSNVLEGGYVSLLGDDDSDYRKIYGAHYEKLVMLKKKYDPGNVFKYAVPRISV